MEAWRESGLRASEFCVGREFKVAQLYFWSSKLGTAPHAAGRETVPLARVVRRPSMERVTEDESEVEPRLVDLRWGFDRLAGVAEERIGRKARGGALFVFFGKRRDALKVLFEVRPGAKRAAGVH